MDSHKGILVSDFGETWAKEQGVTARRLFGKYDEKPKESQVEEIDISEEAPELGTTARWDGEFWWIGPRGEGQRRLDHLVEDPMEARRYAELFSDLAGYAEYEEGRQGKLGKFLDRISDLRIFGPQGEKGRGYANTLEQWQARK